MHTPWTKALENSREKNKTGCCSHFERWWLRFFLSRGCVMECCAEREHVDWGSCTPAASAALRAGPARSRCSGCPALPRPALNALAAPPTARGDALGNALESNRQRDALRRRGPGSQKPRPNEHHSDDRGSHKVHSQRGEAAAGWPLRAFAATVSRNARIRLPSRPAKTRTKHTRKSILTKFAFGRPKFRG